MKLNKEKIKTGLKIQLNTIKYMMFFNIISFPLLVSAFMNNTSIGKSGNNGLFPINNLHVNLYTFTISILILLTIYSIFWIKYLKKNLYTSIQTHWIFTVLFIILFSIFYIVELFIAIIAVVCSTGIFSSVRNIPEFIYYIIIFYPIAFSIIDFFITLKKNKF